MPTKRKSEYPDGWDDIENDIIAFKNKMKDAQNKPPPPGAKHRAQWEIFQISHQRSRYVFDLYDNKEAISTELYDWLIKKGHADRLLMSKWRKEGYENVSLARVCARGDGMLTGPAALLSTVCPNKGDELQLDVHLPRSKV